MALSSLVELMQQRVVILKKEVEDADEAIRKISIPEKRADKPIAAKRARGDQLELTSDEVKKDHGSAPLISSAIGAIRKSTEEDPRTYRNGAQRVEKDREDLSKMRKDTLTKLGSGQDRDRNKRLFGALLAGTLQKFRTEQEQSKQTEVKRKQIEDKIQLREEREVAELTHRRSTLVRERKYKDRIAKRLERKLKVATLFDSWCARQLAFAEFIPTRCADAFSSTTSSDRQMNSHRSGHGAALSAADQPTCNVYYRPRLLNDATQALLDAHRRQIQEMVNERRRKLENEIENLLEQLDSSAHKQPETNRLVSCIANADAGGALPRSMDSESDASDTDSPSDEELLAFGRSVNVRSIPSYGRRTTEKEQS